MMRTLFLILLFAYILDSVVGAYCYQKSFSKVRRLYCSFGCCGPPNRRYCCSSSTGGGVITGFVLSGIAVMAVLAIIIRCCIKKTTRQCRVIGPILTGTHVSTQTSESKISMVSQATSYQINTMDPACPYPGGFNHMHSAYPYPDAALSPDQTPSTVSPPPPYSQVEVLEPPVLPPAYSQSSTAPAGSYSQDDCPQRPTLQGRLPNIL